MELDHRKIKELAGYAVSECTKHSKGGRWQISYGELCQKSGVEPGDINQNKKLLEKELRQREEINELIMTEDGIEMACCLEYCEQCSSNPFRLLSVIGCNIYEEQEQKHEPAEGSVKEDIPQVLSM